jgi:hypothetical protein
MTVFLWFLKTLLQVKSTFFINYLLPFINYYILFISDVTTFLSL